MCAARARDVYEEQAKARMVSGKKADPVGNFPQGQDGISRDAAGKAFGVSGKSVDFAKKVIANGTPELIEAIDNGRMAVNTAGRYRGVRPSLLPCTAKHRVTGPKRKFTGKPTLADNLFRKIYLNKRTANPVSDSCRTYKVCKSVIASGYATRLQSLPQKSMQ